MGGCETLFTTKNRPSICARSMITKLSDRLYVAMATRNQSSPTLTILLCNSSWYEWNRPKTKKRCLHVHQNNAKLEWKYFCAHALTSLPLHNWISKTFEADTVFPEQALCHFDCLCHLGRFHPTRYHLVRTCFSLLLCQTWRLSVYAFVVFQARTGRLNSQYWQKIVGIKQFLVRQLRFTVLFQ